MFRCCLIHLKKHSTLANVPIKFSNGQVGMCEVIGQEPIDISRGIILIHNHTECIGYHQEVFSPVSLIVESLTTPVLLSTGCSSTTSYFMLSLALVTKKARWR